MSRRTRSRRDEAKVLDFLFEPQPEFNGLSYSDLDTLGTYNAERLRGIVHTPEWQAKMAAMQAVFDAGERERAVRHLFRRPQ